MASSGSRSRRVRVLLSVAVAAAALLSGTPGSAATAAAAPAPRTQATSTSQARAMPADPAVDVTAAVSYAKSCYASRVAAAGAACQQALVADINAARALEHVRPLVLPRGYARLTGAQQVFVVTNLERVDRGLAPVSGLSATLDTRARQGAAATADPSIAGWRLGGLNGRTWTSIQATDSNALESDWLWMYQDGWSAAGYTSNVDCTSAHGSGCWGHRHNILATYPGSTVIVAGAAAVSKGPFVSYAELVLAGTGTAPKLHYTWKQALAAGADRH